VVRLGCAKPLEKARAGDFRDFMRCRVAFGLLTVSDALRLKSWLVPSLTPGTPRAFLHFQTESLPTPLQ